MNALEALAGWLGKSYEGFTKLEHKLAAKRGKKKVKDPGALAASIGMKKYGKAKFEGAAAKGKKLGKAVQLSPTEQLGMWLVKAEGTTEQPASKPSAAPTPQGALEGWLAKAGKPVKKRKLKKDDSAGDDDFQVSNAVPMA